MLSIWKIRIDTQDYEKIIFFCNRYMTNWLYCFENEGTTNVHCHLYVETTEKEATIRGHIRTKFGCGNGAYSMNTLDSVRPIEYLAYVVKGRVYFHNLPEDLIENALAYDDKVKESIKVKKAAKKTQLQLCEELLIERFKPVKYYIDRREDITCYCYVDETGHKTSIEVEDILVLVIDFYVDNGLSFRRHAAKSIVDSLALKYNHVFRTHTMFNMLKKEILGLRD